MKFQYQEITEIILRVVKSGESEDGINDYRIVKNSKMFLGRLLDYCEGKYPEEVKIISRAYDDQIGNILYQYLLNKNMSLEMLMSLIDGHMLDNLGLTGVWRYFCIEILKNIFNWDYQLRLSDFIEVDKKQYEAISQLESFEKDVFNVLTHVLAADDKHIIVINQYGGTFSTKEIKDISSWNDMIQVVAGEGHFAGLKADHLVLDTSSRIQEKVNCWKDIISIDAGKDFVVGLNKDHRVVVASAVDKTDIRRVTDSWRDIKDISAKDHMITGLDADGKVYVVGFGQVDTIEFSRTDIVKVFAGGDHAIAIFNDGSIECSGYVGKYDHGQCKVSDFSRIAALSTNPFHTVAVDSMGGCIITPYSSIDEYDIKYSYGDINIQSYKDLLTVAASNSFFVGIKNDGSLTWGGDIDNRVRNIIRGWRLFSDKDKYINRFIEYN